MKEYDIIRLADRFRILLTPLGGDQGSTGIDE